MNAQRLDQRAARRARQEGIVLFVAIIVLMIMTLAGLALLRQMGTGTSIAGNVAFKENATSVADRGSEVARKWLIDNAPILANDNFAMGYHSSWTGSTDPSALPWDTQSLTLNDDAAQTGNTTQVIIQRLCETPNMSALDASQRCSDVGTSSSTRTGDPNDVALSTNTPAPLFRVTARVVGPRRTVSYTQVLLSSN